MSNSPIAFTTINRLDNRDAVKTLDALADESKELHGRIVQEAQVVENIDSLVQSVFRTEELISEFAPIAGLINRVGPEFRLPLMLEMIEHPPVHLMLQQIAHLNIVYSPPKVGSTTMCETLMRMPTIHCRSKIRHLHFLNPKGLAFISKLNAAYVGHPEEHVWLQHLAHCHWMRLLLAANRAVRNKGADPYVVSKPFVLTGVREPIAQYLSMVFHLDWMFADSIDKLTSDYLQKRISQDPWLHQFNDWFTDDLAGTFDVNVYASPFPAERGWDIYENDNARILLVRQENLDQLQAAFGEFYGLDPATIEIARANEGENKAYAEQYAVVKRTFRLSEKELDEIYSMPYVRHFYTPEEIAEFKKRWGSSPEERSRLRSVKKRTATVNTPKSRSITSRVVGKYRSFLRRIVRGAQKAR
jgi:Putative capsular polysaccharide synthesis protein